MRNSLEAFRYHFDRYGWPQYRSVLLTPLPRDMRMSRRMRNLMKRTKAHNLDIERQYHISDDVSECRYMGMSVWDGAYIPSGASVDDLAKIYTIKPDNRDEVLAYQANYYK